MGKSGLYFGFLYIHLYIHFKSQKITTRGFSGSGNLNMALDSAKKSFTLRRCSVFTLSRKSYISRLAFFAASLYTQIFTFL
jgi:hypothetical protein